MKTKVMTKSSKINQRTTQVIKIESKNNSSDQDRIKNNSRLKRKVTESIIKIQGSRSRFKTQDSRIKRRLNQDKYEKLFSKIE